MNKKVTGTIISLSLVALLLAVKIAGQLPQAQPDVALWQVQSIDTMKYSRDTARGKAEDPAFDLVIFETMREIAGTGATHVAIGTPYDEEFVPYMTRWVDAARQNGLKVWFRGNFSGWEGWFGYRRIGRDEHRQLLRAFLEKNPQLFKDGDIFSPCPECENGGPGDPRMNNDAEGHRLFLIDETRIANEIFRKHGLQVASNYHSMNGDVARLIMDKKTTKALGGLVVVDHYVGTPEQLAEDVREYAANSGGKVVLGEFGAPIPDIHGELSEEEQALWIGRAMYELAPIRELAGLNYWVGRGGSTRLWEDNGRQRRAVATLSGYYKPVPVRIQIENPLGMKLPATAVYLGREYTTDMTGTLFLPFLGQGEVYISAKGYPGQTVWITDAKLNSIIVLEPEKKTLSYYVQYILSIPLNLLRNLNSIAF